MQASKADLVERLLELEQKCAQTQQQLACPQFALLEAQQTKAAGVIDNQHQAVTTTSALAIFPTKRWQQF
jgi:hypothetical protein